MSTEIIITIITVAGTLGGIFLKWWLDKRKKNDHSKNDQFETGLKKIRTVYGILNEITIDTDAGRAMLLKCENGGGIPRVGCELFSTVIYESFETLPPIQNQWNKQRIDKQYTEMLYDVYRHGQFSAKVKDIERGDLKDLLTAHDVDRFYVYSVSTANDKFTYLKVDFPKPGELSARERNIIRTSIAKLAKIFNDKGEP